MQSAESLAVVSFRVNYSWSWSFVNIQSFVHKFHPKYQRSVSYIRGSIKSPLLSACTVDGVWYYGRIQILLHKTIIALTWWILFYWSFKIILLGNFYHLIFFQYSFSLHLYHHYIKVFSIDTFTINFCSVASTLYY